MEIHFVPIGANGRVCQNSFETYRVPLKDLGTEGVVEGEWEGE